MTFAGNTGPAPTLTDPGPTGLGLPSLGASTVANGANTFVVPASTASPIGGSVHGGTLVPVAQQVATVVPNPPTKSGGPTSTSSGATSSNSNASGCSVCDDVTTAVSSHLEIVGIVLAIVVILIVLAVVR